MMEKSKFDFDFLSTILEHLQGARPVESSTRAREVLGPLVGSLLDDLQQPGVLQGVQVKANRPV